MLFKAIGLSTYRQNNNLKSILLLCLYPLFVVACFAVFFTLVSKFFLPQVSWQGNFLNITPFLIWALPATALWFLISYFFQTRMIRSLSLSHPVERKDEPELYNLLENLSIAQGIKTPRLEIIETHMLNAFASGVDERTHTVTVTRGLLNSLQKDELEAVLAHELTHILNRDTRLMIISILFCGFFGFLIAWIWRILRVSGRAITGRRVNQHFVVAIMALAVFAVGYLMTVWTRFALSRRREYDADAGAVEMTRNPDAMMRALMRISGRGRESYKMPTDIALMCIDNKRKFWGMFDTHPPIDRRIAALSEMTNTAIPTLPSPIPNDDERVGTAPSKHSHENPWVTTKGK